MDKIIVKGARAHNLKNINIEIPKNKLVVMTGLSGSGKSSLAFDTIYQEGQRRFIESLGSYARQFLGGNEKPDVDSIEGLSPAISIDQKTTNNNPRSTVGTVTEIFDYLRLLYARIATPYCPEHKTPIESQTISQMVDNILKIKEGSRILILSPVVQRQKGEHKQVFEKYLKEGFIRGRVNGEIVMFEDEIKLDKNKKHDIDVVIERLAMKDDVQSRILEAVELAAKFSGGYVKVLVDNEEELFFSEHYACLDCGYSVPKLEPRLFSFNSPLGACPECNGLGIRLEVTEDLVIDPNLSLNEGAIIPYRNQQEKENLTMSQLKQVCEYYNIDADKPYNEFTDLEKEIILYKSPDKIDFTLSSSSGRIHKKTDYYEGIIANFSRRYIETSSDWAREWIEGYMVERECSTCHGDRLSPMMLNIFIEEKNIIDLCKMSIEDLYDFFINLKLSGEKEKIANLVVKEITDRLKFLINVGLEYLSLSRSAVTLSGGESQRIRLATQIGSRLTGVLYVLDEPSIGLHQRDNDRLIASLLEMRDLGNTLIVVEHDEDTMMACDYLIDIGPGAGVHGGTVVAAGTAKEVMANDKSLTGKYLTGKMKIELPEARRTPREGNLEVIGATENNLKDVSVKFPLGVITCVTGVSGSGKSSLVNEVLYKNLYTRLYKAKKVTPGKVKEIKGFENIEKIIQISQTPIGRTPRSNPATYTGVFDEIREIFTQTNEAKIRGYNKGRFSFNVKGGRCEACWGDGVKKISMNFLPDVYVTCEVCNGTRYQKETLEIKYKGKNIYDVLQMTIEEALSFFENVPKIQKSLETLNDVGLGYMKLGQSSTTISGGEAQRVKLANELNSRITPATLYILDEPTTGLHVDDIKRLMKIINDIANKGATVIIIEHNLEVIKLADYVIDMGYEGGAKGGQVVFTGSVEDLCKCEASYTGKYLNIVMNKSNF